MNNAGKRRPQTRSEESANALSHGIGLILVLVGVPYLLIHSLETGQMSSIIAAGIFSLGMLMVYTSSTLYHSIRKRDWKARLQTADHISIYYLIAGSYTPMVMKVLKKDEALIFLSILWGMVLAGTFFKVFFTGRFRVLSITLYLCMGWLALFIASSVIKNIPMEQLSWIGLGGAFYTLGIYFYVNSHRYYYHFIWHIFVLCGTLSHYIAVYQIT